MESTTVKKIVFSDVMAYVIRWCGRHVCVLQLRIKWYKDSFYEEIGQVFDQFPQYEVKILLGYFSAKSGRKYTCSNWHLAV